MRPHILSLALVGGLGVVAGWWAHSTLSQPEHGSSRAAEAGTPAQNAVIASPVEPTKQQSARRQASGAEAGRRVTDEVGNSSEAGPIELVANQPSDDAPLTGLQTAEKISCRFDPGNAARVNGSNNMSMYELADRPITYDSIDITAGTARMTGSIGATGSREGVLEMQMVATHAGLHFSAVNSRGELLLTTVFGALDEGGRRWAVMTVHGRQADDGSFQVYGSCDAIPPATR
jgi:hypothetical protein